MTVSIRPEPVDQGLETAVAAALPVPITLPASPRSAGIARRLLRLALEDLVGPEVLCDVQLLATELVANAVAASGDFCVLSVSVPETEVLRVAVADPDQCLPAPGIADLLAEQGRGLHIVKALALRWGVDRSAVGKTVWFEMQSVGPYGGSLPRGGSTSPDS